MATRRLGLTVIDGGALSPTFRPAMRAPTRETNTRNSLWPERWPAIAKTECIDEVEAAEPQHRAEVKFALPCATCELASACLNSKSKELGTLLYDREILTNPRSSESSLFPRELLEPMLNLAGTFMQSYHKPMDRASQLAVAQAWDVAWSERTGGDYMVGMTALVDLVTGKRRLIGLERFQRLSFDEQCELIELKWRQYHADVVCIESDAAQSVWAQHLRQTTPVPVRPHAGNDKKDLQLGVPGLLIQLQNRKWEFPYKAGSWGFDEMENFLSELEAFGWNEGKLQGVGEHDDTVMAFWHLSWVIDKSLLRPPVRSYRGNQAGRSQ